MLYYVYYVCMFIHRNVYNIYHSVSVDLITSSSLLGAITLGCPYGIRRSWPQEWMVRKHRKSELLGPTKLVTALASGSDSGLVPQQMFEQQSVKSTPIAVKTTKEIEKSQSVQFFFTTSSHHTAQQVDIFLVKAAIGNFEEREHITHNTY